MNREAKRIIGKTRRSQLSRRLLLQYFLALFGFIGGFGLLIIISWRICSLFTWRGTEPLYWILNFIQEYIVLFIGVFGLIGWISITYHFIQKPLRFLDEVIDASENLATHSSEPVVLSQELASVQNELNLVRESALNSAMAAQSAEQRKKDLIMYLAHDLKTPLASVIGYLNLLHDEGQISEELREKYLSISLDKAQRLEDLINEFFEIARFNLSAITLQYSKINMTLLLEQLVYEFKPMLQEKNLTCSLSIAQDTMLYCDGNKIQRVFDNLLRNAVIYSFADTDIQIRSFEKNGYLVIRFVNHGNTIPKESLERIFEQFYRLDASRSTSSGGAGLGLAIAKQIVELHKGTITAKSENNLIGFEVTLPIL